MRGVVLSFGDWERHLAVGRSCSIGRGPVSPRTGEPIDIVLTDDNSFHRHAATVRVVDVGWQLEAEGRLRLRVVDVPTGGQQWAVPGYPPVLVHSQVARIEFDVSPTERLTVVVKDDRVCARDAPGHIAEDDAPTAQRTMNVRLDDSTGYFRALVALCEPMLVDPSDTALPSDQQIALRLNRSGRETRRQTARSIERRLSHLRSRVGLKAGDSIAGGMGLEVTDARRRLAEYAITAGLVSRDNLRVLGPESEQ